MKTPKFEQNKVSRLIRTAGVEYEFKRDSLNEFKEPTGEAVSVAVVKGVFHQFTEHISITGADAASVQSKQVPYILALYADAKDIKQGDYTVINGTKYLVNGVNDVMNWNIVIDISLEAVV